MEFFTLKFILMIVSTRYKQFSLVSRNFLLALIIKMEIDILYIKNRSEYFSENLIDILNFKTSDLKLDKKNMERS